MPSFDKYTTVPTKNCNIQENGGEVVENACTNQDLLKIRYNAIITASKELGRFKEGCGIALDENGTVIAALCSDNIELSQHNSNGNILDTDNNTETKDETNEDIIQREKEKYEAIQQLVNSGITSDQAEKQYNEMIELLNSD